MRRATRHDEIVAFRGSEPTEHRLEHEAASVHVHELVARRVAIERGGLGDGRPRERDLVVAEQVTTSEHGVGVRRGRQLAGPQVVRLQGHVRREHGLRCFDALDRPESRWRVAVIEERRRGREALLAHELLRRDLAVDAVERVALAGDVADAAVRRHDYRFPRLAWSRSIASKSALKLPSPKPFAPSRSMISKKTAGRSVMVSVKICSRCPSWSRSTRMFSRSISSHGRSMPESRSRAST